MYFFLYTSTMVSFHMGISFGIRSSFAIGISSKQAFEHCSLLAKHAYLVGALEHDFYDFPYIGNVIIPTDFHIFRRGETTNQLFSELGTSYIHASWFFFCSTWAWTFKEQAQDPVDHRSSVPLHFRIKKKQGLLATHIPDWIPNFFRVNFIFPYFPLSPLVTLSVTLW